jgi:hypothetical protein
MQDSSDFEISLERPAYCEFEVGILGTDTELKFFTCLEPFTYPSVFSL